VIETAPPEYRERAAWLTDRVAGLAGRRPAADDPLLTVTGPELTPRSCRWPPTQMTTCVICGNVPQGRRAVPDYSGPPGSMSSTPQIRRA
jgi:hypothetical protein